SGVVPCQPSSMVIRSYPAACSPRDFIARACVSTSASVADRPYWYQVLYPMTGRCAAASPALRANRLAAAAAGDWMPAGGAAAGTAATAIAATVRKAAAVIRRDMKRDVPQ